MIDIQVTFVFVDQIVFDRQKSRADGDFYAVKQQAQANQLLLTPEYLELKRYESIATNAKLYFGSDIPKFFVNGENDRSSVLRSRQLAAGAVQSEIESETPPTEKSE